MNKEQMSNEDILNECLEAVLRGETEETCLTRYPEQAAELKPLLKTMMATREACRTAPRPEFRARARYEYRCAVADACTKEARKGLRWNWRWSTAIPVAVAVMMMSGGGVMAASTLSLPGQPLYDVKLAMEDMQVKLTPSSDAKTEVYAAIAERRVGEIVALAETNKPILVGETTIRLEETLAKVTGNMQLSVMERNGQFGTTDAGAQPPMALTPETTADTTKAIAGAPVTQAPTSAPATITGIDPELLAVLKGYAARDQARLQAIMAGLPENTRVILQHVIDDYQAILSAQPAPVS